jgi:hypothetical protein
LRNTLRRHLTVHLICLYLTSRRKEATLGKRSSTFGGKFYLDFSARGGFGRHALEI